MALASMLRTSRCGSGKFIVVSSFALMLILFSLPTFARTAEQMAPENIPVTKECVCKKDIVDTAVASRNFKTLAAALEASGMVETLKGKGPYTVFAPTDAAFAKLPPGTLEVLFKPENKDKLAAFLSHHVIAGKVKAKDLARMSEAKPLNGKELKITVEHGKPLVGGAHLTKTNIQCNNGVIHAIDSVL